MRFHYYYPRNYDRNADEDYDPAVDDEMWFGSVGHIALHKRCDMNREFEQYSTIVCSSRRAFCFFRISMTETEIQSATHSLRTGYRFPPYSRTSKHFWNNVQIDQFQRHEHPHYPHRFPLEAVSCNIQLSNNLLIP